jgi:hypothetical protein
MTEKALEIMQNCNCKLILFGPNEGKMMISAHTASGKTICSEIKEGLWREEAQEIKAYLTAERNAQLVEEAAIQAKIDAIEGLKEIKSAIYDRQRYHREFNAMMDDEFNDGAFPPKPPKADVDELMAKYPRATAYIKAEKYSYAAHDVKSKAGKKALEKIINGEDYEKAIADMETEWTAHVDKHMWD